MLIRLMTQEKVRMLSLVTTVFQKYFTLYWHYNIPDKAMETQTILEKIMKLVYIYKNNVDNVLHIHSTCYNTPLQKSIARTCWKTQGEYMCILGFTSPLSHTGILTALIWSPTNKRILITKANSCHNWYCLLKSSLFISKWYCKSSRSGPYYRFCVWTAVKLQIPYAL